MRAATEADEPGIAALAAVAGGSGWWGTEQRTGPDHPDRRRHVEADGERIVAYGCVWRRRGTIFGLDALVHPEARGRRLGTRVFDRLFEDLAELGATACESRIDADHREALAFMVRRGFFELGRVERVRLDVELAPDVAPPSLPEVTIAPVGQARDPETMRSLHDFIDAAFQVEHRPMHKLEPFLETPFEQLTIQLEDAVGDGCFIASAGGRIVGFSGLAAGPEPGSLTAFLTAVAPDHRHKGVATALKRHTIAYARRTGHRAIFSSSPDRSMQDLNEMLGFERCAAAEIRMGRRV